MKVTAKKSTVPQKAKVLRTLAIDVGGTGIKSVVLDQNGKAVSEFRRLKTPQPAKPAAILETIVELAKQSGEFDRVALGFPGVVRNGEVITAPHLHDEWIGVRLDKELQRLLRRPARVANDAAVQGFAAISGKGIEMVITLGTSMGSALYVDGHVIPNEMGHHPFRKGKTYEDEVGNAVLEKIGRKRWNRKLEAVIDMLEKTFNYDRLYIGGGNAKNISVKLPKNVRTVDNKNGLYGAIALWK